MVDIIQADRDAAADLVTRQLGHTYAPALVAGNDDGHYIVQAFARHRLAHSQPASEGLREALERTRQRLLDLAWEENASIIEDIDAALATQPLTEPQRLGQEGEVETTVRQTSPVVADYDEHFLIAHVSKDGSLVGIDHPCDAVWSDVMRAHVALRDRINERIAEQAGCPFKPALSTPAQVERIGQEGRHIFVPHSRYPWFCGACGYPPHETLQHIPSQNKAEVDVWTDQSVIDATPWSSPSGQGQILRFMRQAGLLGSAHPPAPPQPEYGRIHTDGSRSGGQPLPLLGAEEREER